MGAAMRYSTYFAIFAFTALAAFSPSRVLSEEKVAPLGASESGLAVSGEDYHAWQVKKQNENKVLPSLNYWGLGKFNWGSRLAVRSTDQRAVAAMIAPAKDPASRACLFAGLECEFKLILDRQGDLVSVRRIFLRGNGKIDRRLGLAYYKRIKKALEAAYNAPSHNLKPDYSIDGKDVYASGLVSEYLVQWEGPETIVSLSLTDSDLVLDFSRSPSSSSKLLHQRAAKAEQLMKSRDGHRSEK